MTEAPTSPTPAKTASKYLHWKQAEAYLRNFLGRGRRHYIKTNQYAKYRCSIDLDVIVIRLAPHIYEVRAYPLAALYVVSLEDGLTIEEFRGWIFINDPRTRKSVLFFSSQREGIESYRLVKLAIRHEGTLARADFYYRRLLASR
ncbi:hypothetical protein ES703_70950 [subsurface metagenome]